MLAVVFYALAAATVALALLVILARNPVHSVLFLVLVFFGISAMYLLILDASFVGVVNIIVYAGAIMVLFLYVIMLMNLNQAAEPRHPRWYAWAVGGAAALLLLVLASTANLLLQRQGTPEAAPADIGTARTLGKILYTDYILPFEVASVLFLVAIIGAVVLGRKDAPPAEEETLTQNS
ncbi:MAG: NADH-quinone oxidoreductase subunit J [Chitinophagales bacterium]|nr:NADH-quinone oxidoreductase subunit J [Chitinophagales bacterium]MDW8393382.1 NADH-quinone oxidoreductase subunit J [Chitinophagales bacterium]